LRICRAGRRPTWRGFGACRSHVGPKKGQAKATL
jgi:hypothetical protein